MKFHMRQAESQVDKNINESQGFAFSTSPFSHHWQNVMLTMYNTKVELHIENFLSDRKANVQNCNGFNVSSTN